VFIREADYSVNGERTSVGVFRARLAKNDYRLCRQHSFRRHFERSYRFSRVFIFARPRADGRYGRRRESGSVATRRDATRRGSRSGRKVFLFGRHRMPAIGMSFYRYTLSHREASKSPR